MSEGCSPRIRITPDPRLPTGHALYDVGGLRFWTSEQLRRRRMIEDAIVGTVSETLLGLNQMFAIHQVETPLLMPRRFMNEGYTEDDVFELRHPPGGIEPYGLRPETTEGTYRMATALLKTGAVRPPVCFYQSGPSFRRETNDGASASRLRFNQFNQLEFQIIVSEDTKAPLMEDCREALVKLVARLCGTNARLVDSDRLPAYATETIDIEAYVTEMGNQGELNPGWREVASTSRRTDWPQLSTGKPLKVLEIAFGLDRMVALSA